MRLQSDFFERALGAPGEPGDPDRILHGNSKFAGRAKRHRFSHIYTTAIPRPEADICEPGQTSRHPSSSARGQGNSTRATTGGCRVHFTQRDRPHEERGQRAPSTASKAYNASGFLYETWTSHIHHEFRFEFLSLSECGRNAILVTFSGLRKSNAHIASAETGKLTTIGSSRIPSVR